MPKKIYKPIVHNQYLDGKLVDKFEHMKSDIIILPDKSFICTCGNRLGSLRSVAIHKRTFNHLILTKQIDEYHPTLTKYQQRDALLSSGIKLI